MTNLSSFWEHSMSQSDAHVDSEVSNGGLVEKTTRQLPAFSPTKKALLVVGIALVAGVLIGTNLPKRDSGEKLLLDIKEDIGEEARLAGPALDATDAAVLGTAETAQGKIKVLSANLVGIYQQVQVTPSLSPTPTPEATGSASLEPTAQLQDEEATSESLTKAALEPQASSPEPEFRLAGIRILGEMQNVGNSTVYGANTFVRFYNTSTSTPGDSLRETPDVSSTSKLVAIKVGEWNQGYKFLPLAPDQTGVYDIVVLSPPEFANVTIEVKVDPTVKKSSFVTESLKIKSKTLEPTTMEQGNQQLNYFTFNGSLVNKDQSEIVNPSIYVWLKNSEGKVIGLAAKTLASDLLLPGQELSVSLFVIPVTSDEMASYEVRTFGNKL